MNSLNENSQKQSNSPLLSDKFEDKLVCAISKQSQSFQDEMKKQSQTFKDELKEISNFFMKQLKESLELQSQSFEAKLITAISTQLKFMDAKLKGASNQPSESK